MKDNGIVQGSKEWAVPLRVEKTTVYVHTDIEKLPDTEEHTDMYEFHEIEYTKDEYIKFISESYQQDMTEMQLALVESYEELAVTQEELAESKKETTDLQLAVVELYEMLG